MIEFIKSLNWFELYEMLILVFIAPLTVLYLVGLIKFLIIVVCIFSFFSVVYFLNRLSE